MIIFKGVRQDNKGIEISSLYENEIKVLAKIIDGYSGLCSYATPITLHPGSNYFFAHFVDVYHRRFEVWDLEEETLYLRIDIQDDGSPNLETLDKFKCLKDFKYENKKDRDPALPLYEIFCQNLYAKPNLIKPGDVVFDIGGNVGFFSYYAICKGADKVYCFEPSKEAMDTIKQNFNFPNLILEESAVTSTNGTVEFYLNEESSIQSGLYNTKGNKTICKSVNLNDYITQNNIEKIDYLKIDCEGSEYDVVESLSDEYLSNHISNMCIEYHFNTNGKIHPMLDKLKRCGFQLSEVANTELGVFYAWK